MKKAIVMLLALAIAMTSVSAFEVEKWVSVTGDWKWEADHWESGNYETAQFGNNFKSNQAISAWYSEPVEVLGEAWKYQLESHAFADAPTKSTAMLSAWTVNDPATTPATGGYTKYSYEENDFGAYTTSHVKVSGQGYVDVNTNTNFKGDSNQQDMYVKIN